MNNQKKRIQGNDKTVNTSQISEYEYLIKHDLNSLKTTLEKEKYKVWVVKYGEEKAKDMIKELILSLVDNVSYRRIESKYDLYDWAVTTFKLDSPAPIVQNTTIIKKQNIIQKQTIIPQQNIHKTFNYHNDYKVKNDNRVNKTNNTNNQFNQFNDAKKNEPLKRKKEKTEDIKNQKKQNSKKVMPKVKRKKGARDYIPNIKYTEDMKEKFWSIRGDTKQPLEDCYTELQKHYEGKTKIEWGTFDSFIRSARKHNTSRR